MTALRGLWFITFSCVRFVARKKKRCDEIPQIGKRPQGDPGEFANLEQGGIRSGHPLRKMQLGSVRMPNNQYRLSTCSSTSKACHAATRQRMETVMNRHRIMKTGRV